MRPRLPFNPGVHRKWSDYTTSPVSTYQGSDHPQPDGQPDGHLGV